MHMVAFGPGLFSKHKGPFSGFLTGLRGGQGEEFHLGVHCFPMWFRMMDSASLRESSVHFGYLIAQWFYQCKARRKRAIALTILDAPTVRGGA
jgi:hypothetical protein